MRAMRIKSGSGTADDPSLQIGMKLNIGIVADTDGYTFTVQSLAALGSRHIQQQCARSPAVVVIQRLWFRKHGFYKRNESIGSQLRKPVHGNAQYQHLLRQQVL